MSVARVTLTASDEQYVPPAKEIELAVIGNDVFITIYEGSTDDLSRGRTKEYEVPMLALHDLIAALTAFGDYQQGVRFGRLLSAEQAPAKRQD